MDLTHTLLECAVGSFSKPLVPAYSLLLSIVSLVIYSCAGVCSFLRRHYYDVQVVLIYGALSSMTTATLVKLFIELWNTVPTYTNTLCHFTILTMLLSILLLLDLTNLNSLFNDLLVILNRKYGDMLLHTLFYQWTTFERLGYPLGFLDNHIVHPIRVVAHNCMVRHKSLREVSLCVTGILPHFLSALIFYILPSWNYKLLYFILYYCSVMTIVGNLMNQFLLFSGGRTVGWTFAFEEVITPTSLVVEEAVAMSYTSAFEGFKSWSQTINTLFSFVAIPLVYFGFPIPGFIIAATGTTIFIWNSFAVTFFHTLFQDGAKKSVSDAFVPHDGKMPQGWVVIMRILFFWLHLLSYSP